MSLLDGFLTWSVIDAQVLVAVRAVALIFLGPSPLPCPPLAGMGNHSWQPDDTILALRKEHGKFNYYETVAVSKTEYYQATSFAFRMMKPRGQERTLQVTGIEVPGQEHHPFRESSEEGTEMLADWMYRYGQDGKPMDLDQFFTYSISLRGHVQPALRLHQRSASGDFISSISLNMLVAWGGFYRWLFHIFLTNPNVTWLNIFPVGHLVNMAWRTLQERHDSPERRIGYGVLGHTVFRSPYDTNSGQLAACAGEVLDPGQHMARIELLKLAATIERDYAVQLANPGQRWQWKAYFAIVRHSKA
ncbi:uncharacterized protein BCR38DRAFT_476634 [Pseudomassariella vexata]|uniref:Uncharacterized protein n=1 Tax=Pseudomassariella vexata TaxID=1141098 RepID=A0A1Y2DNA6_9PEZI|nr:uncharacterized protein BCR38DRAFT_476634 [Pseudomassariella vexata]ORY60741.1 hypothetical protein BCR38DRAFT_476634 [Pseudomassariella vexata]